MILNNIHKFGLGRTHLIPAFVAVVFLISQSWAAEQVVGVNPVLEIIPDARTAGTANVKMGLEGGIPSMQENPSGLADLSFPYLEKGASGWKSSQIHFSHTSYFLGDQYHYLAAAFPLNNVLTAMTGGLSLAMFGSDDIPYIQENDTLPDGTDYNTLNVREYILTSALAKKGIVNLDSLQAGAGVHLLFRDYDQSGIGLRVDLSAAYTFQNNVKLGVAVPAALTSYSRWQSGYSEFSRPQVKLGLGYKKHSPYFYGTFHLAWESEPVWGEEARGLEWEEGTYLDTASSEDENVQADVDQASVVGEALHKDPVGWLQASNAAIEYTSDWGGSLRFGFQDFLSLSSWSAGAGFRPNDWLEFFYSYQSHPSLDEVHRISMELGMGYFFRDNP